MESDSSNEAASDGIAASQPLPVPDHELIRCVGRGAYGEVWLARHSQLGTLRAVKIIRRDYFDDARPFQRKFEGIRRYEPISRGHANLVAILHVGGTNDCFFYVMELADDANVPVAADVRRLILEDPKKARPHPGPLARGEGETLPALGQGETGPKVARLATAIPSPGGE